MKMSLNSAPFLLAALITAPGTVFADAGHGPKLGTGSPADASEATRTIEVEMTDNRYSLSEIDVVAGEVVRFVIHNRGQLVHEFNIGTPGMHASHQEEMLAMMQSGKMSPTKMMHGHGGKMGHDDPNSILLNPGESNELVWRFGEKVEGLEFACNAPGHYQAGMVGQFQGKP